VYFLSAFDENEAPPLYFTAEMPKGSGPQTVAAAREALKPAEVIMAEADGATVLRQGDVFAIAHPGLLTRDLPGPSQQQALVLGVNHRATEVRVKDGRTYARGFLRQNRTPAEHHAVELGDRKTWHHLLRNTVPWQGGRPAAWSIRGRVD
jgi:hypothetical protein